MDVIEVAIGIVTYDGKILICRRHPDMHLGGYWEFPGGKLEPPEPPEACLHRELREELGIQVQITAALPPVEHTYPDRAVRLRPFVCRLLRGHPKPLASTALAWISPADLDKYPFPPANAPLIAELQQPPMI